MACYTKHILTVTVVMPTLVRGVQSLKTGFELVTTWDVLFGWTKSNSCHQQWA